MRLFETVKTILKQIQSENALPDLSSLKDNNILIARYIHEKGLEQDVLAKNLHPLMGQYGMSETFYGYIVWIAGELMNNVFDHAQTLGKTLKGGIIAVAMKDSHIEFAVGDLGVGIKASLEKNPLLQKEIAEIPIVAVIEKAFLENTSGWPYKRGNSLPDVLRIVMAGGGTLYMRSDECLLIYKAGSYRHLINTEEHLQGVLACVELEIKDFDVPRRGKPKGKVLKLVKFGLQLSGREKGQEAYEILVRELTSLPKNGALIIDCTGVIMMNSSFGDQALGVLLENIKAGHFGAKKIFFTGEIKEVVDLCLDRIAEIRGVEVAKV